MSSLPPAVHDPNITTWQNLRILFHFLKIMRVRLHYFYFAVACTVFSGFINLIGVRLIYSLVKSVVRGNVSAAHDKFGLLPRLMNKLPDSWNDTTAYIFILLGFIYGSLVLRVALDLFSTISIDQQIEKANIVLKKKIMERQLEFGKLYYDQTPFENIHHAILSCPEIVTQQLLGLQTLMTQILYFLVYIGIMLWISWQFTLVCFLIFPAFNVLTHWLVEKIKDSIQRQEASRRDLKERIFALISRIMLVKAQGSHEWELKQFQESNEEESRLSFKTQAKMHLLIPIEEVSSMTALLLAAIGISLMMPHFDHVSLTSVLIFFFLLRRAMPSFQILSRIKLSLVASADAFKSLAHVFSDEKKFMVPEGDRIFRGLRYGIEFRHLSFRFPERNGLTLDDITFSIPKGRLTAIVGASGAGKSTLVHLLMRFYDCEPGMIFIDGTDIRAFTIKSLLHHIAFVGQDPVLLNASLRQNITYGLDGNFSESRIMEAVEKARLGDLIRVLPNGLNTPVGDRGAMLSGGERQRLAIARAFLKNAEILLLDEATSALDSVTERLIQRALAEVIKGRNTLAIAHRLSTIRHADTVAVIEQGQLKELGSPKELIEKKGFFWQYWEAQQFYSVDGEPQSKVALI